MAQEDINKDLGHYMHERKKSKPLWSKIFNKPARPKGEVQAEIREELMEKEANEDVAPEDKKELEQMEHKIEEVNRIEETVEGDIEEEHEGLLKRFFKKMNFGRDESPEEHGVQDVEPKHSEQMSNTEMREFLKNMHNWIVQLPPEKLHEFKNSKDFELYTKILKKHDLIR